METDDRGDEGETGMADVYIDAEILTTCANEGDRIKAQLRDPEDWSLGPLLTIFRADWPAAYWPPRVGDVVSVRQPVALLKLRPRKSTEPSR